MIDHERIVQSLLSIEEIACANLSCPKTDPWLLLCSMPVLASSDTRKDPSEICMGPVVVRTLHELNLKIEEHNKALVLFFKIIDGLVGCKLKYMRQKMDREKQRLLDVRYVEQQLCLLILETATLDSFKDLPIKINALLGFHDPSASRGEELLKIAEVSKSAVVKRILSLKRNICDLSRDLEERIRKKISQ